MEISLNLFCIDITLNVIYDLVSSLKIRKFEYDLHWSTMKTGF